MTEPFDAAVRAGCDCQSACNYPECLKDIHMGGAECRAYARQAMKMIAAALPEEPPTELLEAMEDTIHDSMLVEIHERVQAPAAYRALRAHVLGGADINAGRRMFAGRQRSMTDDTKLRDFATELEAKQQPLGAEFERVLHDNLDALYVHSPEPSAPSEQALVDGFIASTWGECNPDRYRDAMIAFVARTIADERERCACICDELYAGYSAASTSTIPEQVWLDACDRAAMAIRRDESDDLNPASCQQGMPCGDTDNCPDPVGCGFEMPPP